MPKQLAWKWEGLDPPKRIGWAAAHALKQLEEEAYLKLKVKSGKVVVEVAHHYRRHNNSIKSDQEQNVVMAKQATMRVLHQQI